MAIERSLNWEPESNEEKKKKTKLNPVMPAIYMMFSLTILLWAKHHN